MLYSFIVSCQAGHDSDFTTMMLTLITWLRYYPPDIIQWDYFPLWNQWAICRDVIWNYANTLFFTNNYWFTYLLCCYHGVFKTFPISFFKHLLSHATKTFRFILFLVFVLNTWVRDHHVSVEPWFSSKEDPLFTPLVHWRDTCLLHRTEASDCTFNLSPTL